MQAIDDANYAAMKSYLERLGAAEYKVHAAAKKKNRKLGKYIPSEYHNRLVELLAKCDEYGFKALKLEQGYASAVGS